MTQGSKRVGIIQSNYIPWRGYFDFISQCDLFIFHDDLQYTKGDWRNRNRVKTAAGTVWLTVPVKYRQTEQLICDTEIDDSTPWRKKHLNVFRESYRAAPHFRTAFALFEEALAQSHRTISELNIALIRRVCDFLGISTPMRLSAEFSPSGSKTDRLCGILRKAGASEYLSGPAARAYLDERQLEEAGFLLTYKSYDYPPYPQLHGGFEGAVSVLDLIAHLGPEAREFSRSRSPNVRAGSHATTG